MSRLRIARWWPALAVASVVLAAIAIGEGTGWPFLRVPLQHAMVRAAGVPVQVAGRFHARLLWRPRLEIERLTVGAAGGVTAPHLLEGHNVALEWRWRDLWHWLRGGVLRLRALQAGMLDVQL